MQATILFLASDSIIRKVIAEALESDGYVVVPVSGIGDAADGLNKCTPDLLMIRHYTDTISGHDAAMNLQRRFPGIPVLLLGGLLDDDRLQNREILQGFDIFPKPFELAELVSKVKEMLVKRSPRNSAAGNSA